jgi:hypothetical protein
MIKFVFKSVCNIPKFFWKLFLGWEGEAKSVLWDAWSDTKDFSKKLWKVIYG